MSSLRRLVIPTTLAMTLIGTSFVACGSDEDDDPTPGPIGGSGDPIVDAAPNGDGNGDGGDAGDALDAMPDAPDAPEPDAPVG